MKLLIAAAFSALAALSGPAAATTVFAVNTSPTDLGLFAPGTYQIVAGGIIDIARPVNEQVFNLNAAGIPTSPITIPEYAGCNPFGCSVDPVTGQYGVGGSQANLGALLGTYLTNPDFSYRLFSYRFGHDGDTSEY